ncbi:MAG: hypothetical protein IKM79_02805 [Bacteroidales bacterium]|nr:hypothetical protein [Bacteroidales bacterium]
MAQVQMTVSLDSQMQQQIDRYCALSGLTKNAAFDEMISQWNRMFWIPEIEFLEQEEKRRKAREGFNAIRARAERSEFPEMTMDEIIEEIDKARAN